MHTRVVYQAMKALSSFGIPVLRFNFRGTGLSEGVYDDGNGEVEDARAAIHWLHREFGIPILLAGFSFGANVGWRAACGDSRIAGLIGLGMPLQAGGRHYTYEFIQNCAAPKLLVTGAEDPFAPRARMDSILNQAPGLTEIHWIDGAEHFFMGVPGSPAPKLDRMQLAIRAWLQSHFFPAGSV